MFVGRMTFDVRESGNAKKIGSGLVEAISPMAIDRGIFLEILDFREEPFVGGIKDH